MSEQTNLFFGICHSIDDVRSSLLGSATTHFVCIHVSLNIHAATALGIEHLGVSYEDRSAQPG